MEKSNGKPMDVKCETTGRVYPVSPDGQQWEIKIHVIGQFPHGQEVIGECTFRSFAHALVPLMAAAEEAPKLAAALIQKLIADKQQQIVVAQKVPEARN